MSKSSRPMISIAELYDIFSRHTTVTTDSRKVPSNSLFFALKGDNFNGNLFAKAALNSGAAFAIVDEQQDVKDERIILVDNVLETLQQLALWHRKKLDIPIIAITGTNGKTTTKELTFSVLSKQYKVGATRGNLNNHIGVPLTLLSFSEETEIGIVEMGANHLDEISFLCGIAQPDYGLITNVGRAHLEGFGSFEGVVKAKSELYRFIEETGGTIFINANNPTLLDAAGSSIEKLTYGTSPDCYVNGRIIPSPIFLKVGVKFNPVEIEISTRLTGNYNFENVLAAIAIGKLFVVCPEDIKEAIENYLPDNNRSQIINRGSNQIIMDAYNANPSSMQASINNFLSVSASHKTAILGDMLELGSFSAVEHQAIVDLLIKSPSVKVILVGTRFLATRHPKDFMAFNNVAEATQYLMNEPVENNLILIKGSRGIGLEKILGVFIN